MRMQGKKLPSFAMAAYLKTVVNAWPTSARFGDHVPCPFCRDAAAGSKMEHLLTCPAVQAAAAGLLKEWHDWPVQGGFKESLGLHLRPTAATVSVLILWHDIVLQSYLAYKHGVRHELPTVIKGRIRAIARHSSHAKGILLAAYRGTGGASA